jgi:16S rRNA (cytosine1402-N4)-methyltransferase
MVREVIEMLSDAETVIDLTVGAGGHAAALLDAGVSNVFGVDRDPHAVETARQRLSGYGERVRLARGDFSEVLDVAEEAGVSRADGVLYDLGVSSMQLDEPERGFSYRDPGPLDMRMASEGSGAYEVVNEYPEAELERVIREHGEERFARRIAAAIVRARNRSPLQSTRERAAVVASAVP